MEQRTYTGRKNRTRAGSNSSGKGRTFAQKLFAQTIAASLIILILFAAKIANVPYAGDLTVKLKSAVAYSADWGWIGGFINSKLFPGKDNNVSVPVAASPSPTPGAESQSPAPADPPPPPNLDSPAPSGSVSPPPSGIEAVPLENVFPDEPVGRT